MAFPTDNEPQNPPRRIHWPVLLVVMLLLAAAILFLILLPDLGGPGARPAPIKTAIAQIGAFGSALEMFKVDNGSYPANLNAFVIKPASASTNWRPYMVIIPLDPWGHPYLYVSPGSHNTNSYDLSSAGPDGIPGTPDDIKNW